MDTTAVLVAPWIEEAAKGAAVLLVLLFRRREFDGVVDGIVLAGLSGVGFAFTENVLYFGRAFLAGQRGEPRRPASSRSASPSSCAGSCRRSRTRCSRR